MTFEWTPENVNTLRAEWDNNISASLIGDKLGCSKGAVIGKARRLGLTSRGSPIKPRKRLPKPVPGHKLLEELGPKNCRYPVTDDKPFSFCGHKTQVGHVYCEYHVRKSYKKAEEHEPTSRPATRR